MPPLKTASVTRRISHRKMVRAALHARRPRLKRSAHIRRPLHPNLLPKNVANLRSIRRGGDADPRIEAVEEPVDKPARQKRLADATTTPKHFDTTITDGPAKGKTYSAIYELNDNSYRYCGNLRGKERPAKIMSAPGSGVMLQVLKRERQSAKEAFVEVCRKELAATWLAVSFERDGSSASAEELKKIKLIIDVEGKTTSLIDGKVFLAGASAVDPTQDPMTFDVSYTEGVSKGRSTLGIFRIEDGLLTICRRSPGQPRPSEFASTNGSGQILISYKRESAEASK